MTKPPAPGKPIEVPGLGLGSDKPRPNPRANLTVLRLSPTEAFIFSRVDGHTSWADLCAMSGLGFEATADILRRLRAIGVILAPADPVAPVAAPPPPSRPSPVPRAGASGVPTPAPPSNSGPVSAGLLIRHDDGSPVAPALLSEGPGLDRDTKARILRLHRRLAALAAHDLLGVPPGADAATVKKAYFAASKELHPDRYYGKELGPYKERLAEIFGACTRAFEALGGDRKKR